MIKIKRTEYILTKIGYALVIGLLFNALISYQYRDDFFISSTIIISLVYNLIFSIFAYGKFVRKYLKRI